MRVITGLFDSYEAAAQAIRDLKDIGVRSEDLSVVANNSEGHRVDDAEDEVVEDAGAGAGIGALLGGAGGLLAGLGAIALPGLGAVVAGGWLLSTVVGAMAGAALGGVTGGVVGALTGAGVSEADAHVYAESIRRGGTLVTARVDDARSDRADAILHRGRVDVAARRTDYEREGWSSFDEDAPSYTSQQVRDYRESYIPPVL